MRTKEDDWKIFKHRSAGMLTAIALQCGISVLGMHTDHKNEFISAGGAAGMFVIADVTGVRKLKHKFAIAAAAGAIGYMACLEQDSEIKKIQAQKTAIANCHDIRDEVTQSGAQQGVSHLRH